MPPRKESKAPEDKMTRGEFVMELLESWERSLQVARAKGLASIAAALKTAIRVLKSSYSANELYDIEKLKDLE